MSPGLVRVESMIITDQSLMVPVLSGTGQDWSGPYSDSFFINWWLGDLSVKDWSVMIMDSTLTSPGLITDESRTDRGGVNDDQ